MTITSFLQFGIFHISIFFLGEIDEKYTFRRKTGTLNKITIMSNQQNGMLNANIDFFFSRLFLLSTFFSLDFFFLSSKAKRTQFTLEQQPIKRLTK